MTSIYIPNQEPNVILLGDIMLDHVIQGTTYKIANEAPIPVINMYNETYHIGGCGNVLSNLFALGAKQVFLFSRIGNDIDGQHLHSLLPPNTINHMIVDNTFTTISKNRIYSDQTLVCRYDHEIISSIHSEQEQSIIHTFQDVIRNQTISSVIFSDYNKGFLTKHLCQEIISLCNRHHIPTIVDPKIDYTKYIGCTVIKPNRNETRKIFNLDLDTISLEEAHTQIHTLVDCNLSVITLSGNGMSSWNKKNHNHVQENPKEIIDVTGAGDIVCSVLGLYYPFIKDIHFLLQIANHLASISVSHLGVYTITDNDLLHTYQFIHNTKVIDVHYLPKIHSTVFTNGCFDILHSAHIALFKYCKSLGSVVIVGLNSDDSIKRLKGPSRPIHSLQERINILNAIEYIDFIIPFEDDTPIELIKHIQPDFLVKGGDYTIETVIGKEYAKQVSIFNFINGFSTTTIIHKIKHS